ncbi:hypothetical protein F4781DRAFT_392886, partial [Annulohypoxylon bovei var. microspora]
KTGQDTQDWIIAEAAFSWVTYDFVFVSGHDTSKSRFLVFSYWGCVIGISWLGSYFSSRLRCIIPLFT